MDEPNPNENKAESQEVNSLAQEAQSKPIPHSPEFQKQLEQFQQEASQSGDQDKSAVSHHKKSKLVTIIFVVLLVVLIAGGVYWFMNKSKSSKPVATKSTQAVVTKPNYFVSTDKYMCAPSAVTAVLCENVATGTITKYELPHFVETPLSISPSPDGSKLLVASFANHVTSTDQVHYYVIDKNFKLIKQLPSFTQSQDSSGYKWMNDSKSFVYDVRQTGANKQFGPISLYTYDLVSGKSVKLTAFKGTLYLPEVTKSGKIVAFGKGGTDRTGEELVEISPTDGTATDIDATEVYKNFDTTNARIFYSRNTDLFYLSGTNTQSQKDQTVIAKLDASGGKPKLVRVIATNKKIDTPAMITSQGALLPSNSVNAAKKLQVFNGNSVKSLSLNQSDGSLVFTAASLPFTTAASNNQLVKTDYLYEYGTPPAKLHNFLVSLVSQGCKAGQFKSVELYKNDGESQAVLAEGACGNAGFGKTSYYIYKDGTYKLAAATQEGITCAEATKDGISKVVLPDCTPPGQGP